jgi:hypothetical protein
VSNVLIGIIGVILFIGLALAGALILGDDFRTASNSSQAAALMSQMKQAADAIDMWKLKTGNAYAPAIETDWLVPRFLKTPAVNPTSLARNDSTHLYKIEGNNNIYVDNFREPTYAGKWLMAAIGPQSDAKAATICLEIAQTYGQSTVADMNSTDPIPASPTGCILGLSGPGAPGGVGRWYIAYQRIESPTLPVSQQSGWTGG